MTVPKIKRIERAGLPQFFKDFIEKSRKHPYCENCLQRVNLNLHPFSNVAHILPKSKYKSVMCHPQNAMLLCASKDEKNGCHEKFDSAPSIRKEMPVFHTAKQRFLSFKDQIVEVGIDRNLLEE